MKFAVLTTLPKLFCKKSNVLCWIMETDKKRFFLDNILLQNNPAGTRRFQFRRPFQNFSVNSPILFCYKSEIDENIRVSSQISFFSIFSLGHVECRFGNRLEKFHCKNNTLLRSRGWKNQIFTANPLKLSLWTMAIRFDNPAKFFSHTVRNLLFSEIFFHKRSSGQSQRIFDNPTKKKSPMGRNISAESPK